MAGYVNSYTGQNDGASPLSIASVAVTSGQKVIVAASWRENATETVSGVTFNGSATGWAVIQQFTSVGNMNGAFWYGDGLSGTQTVQITMSGACNGLSASVFVVDNATTPTVTASQEGAGGASVSASVTSGASDLMLAIAHVRADVTASDAYTSPATLRTSFVNATTSNTQVGGSRAGSGGSTSIECTFSNPGFANSRIFVVNVPDGGGGGSAVTGTGAATSPAATASGSGARGVQDSGGAVALTGPVATIAGSGTVSTPGAAITGTGALTSPRATISGVAALGHVATGALTSPKPVISGTNIPLATGGGDSRDRRRRGFFIPIYGRG